MNHIQLEKRINAFELLGKYLRDMNTLEEQSESSDKLVNLIWDSHHYNSWFTPENVGNALKSIGESLSKEKLNQWLMPYSNNLQNPMIVRNVGVIMAGNIPVVGFHDFLCVLIAGHRFLGKLSSDDNKLLPAIADKLIEFEPEFANYIEFFDEKLHGFDAIIATGSNNTSRYFEYYFGKYPNIIRKNRNGIGVLTGDESEKELQAFGKDIFQYFGMGCRSISKIFIPNNYSFDNFFEAIEVFKPITDHHKYNNNYEYYRSIYLINQEKHLDNGFLMLKEDVSLASPPSVLNFEYYDSISNVNTWIEMNKELVQCAVSISSEIENSIPLGNAQNPDLWDYSDGVDTLQFLLEL